MQLGVTQLQELMVKGRKNTTIISTTDLALKFGSRNVSRHHKLAQTKLTVLLTTPSPEGSHSPTLQRLGPCQRRHGWLKNHHVLSELKRSALVRGPKDWGTTHHQSMPSCNAPPEPNRPPTKLAKCRRLHVPTSTWGAAAARANPKSESMC